jgi:hypothetical protein
LFNEKANYMKRFISLFISIVLIAGASFTNSCKKDKVRGCTDKDSQNYDPAAEKDDGSCEFVGAVVFWYDKAASDGLLADGATALTFYLNGEVIGSSATSVYWTASPTCSQNGSITAEEELGNVKTHSYTLSVKDQTAFEYWNAVVNIEANTCTQFQLLWSARKK